MCGAIKQVVLGSFNNDHDDGKKKTGSLYDLLKKQNKTEVSTIFFCLRKMLRSTFIGRNTRAIRSLLATRNGQLKNWLEMNGLACRT